MDDFFFILWVTIFDVFLRNHKKKMTRNILSYTILGQTDEWHESLWVLWFVIWIIHREPLLKRMTILQKCSIYRGLKIPVLRRSTYTYIIIILYNVWLNNIIFHFFFFRPILICAPQSYMCWKNMINKHYIMIYNNIHKCLHKLRSIKHTWKTIAK